MSRARTIARARLLIAGLAAVLPVAAAHAVSCTVTPTGVAFGNYDPSGTTADQSTGGIAVSCQNLVLSITPMTIALSSGSSGTMAMRTMVNGASQLQYQLYSDAARSIVAGDGTGGSSAMAVTMINVLGAVLGPGSATFNVYGQIPARQMMAAPGSYLDTVLVTVTF